MSDSLFPDDPPRRPLPPPRPAPRAAGPPPRQSAPANPPSFSVAPNTPHWPSSSGNTAKVVVLVLGIVFGGILLFCGGLVAMFVFGVQRTAQRVREVQSEVVRAQQDEARQHQEAARRVHREMLEARERDIARNLQRAPTSRRSATIRQVPPVDPEANLPPFDKHLKWLQTRDGRRISEAAKWFAQQPLDASRQVEVQHALVQHLGQGFTPQAPELLAALAVWGNADSVPALVNVAKQQSQHASTATTLIAKFDDERATAALIELLRHGREQAEPAAQVLAQRGDQAKSSLLPLMNEPDQRLRGDARRLLGQLNVSGDELATQAIHDLGDDLPGKRGAALEWLGTAELSANKRTDATKAIAARLEDSDRGVREAAIKALLADSSQTSSDILLPLVSNREAPWTQALQALIARGDKRVAEPLGKLVKEPLTMGQSLQAIRTATGPGEDVVLHLIETSTDDELVRHVCFALAQSGTQKSVPTLQKVLARAEQKKDGGLKIAAQHALKQINDRGQ